MKRSQPRHSQSGLALAEVLFAAGVLGLVVVSAAWSMTVSARSLTGLAEDSLLPRMLAREIHELAQTLPRVPSGTTGASNGADVVALDSLIGAVFSPPLLSDLSTDTSLVGWSQQVSLDVVDLSAPSTPTADDPAAGLPVDGTLLYRLNVSVWSTEGEQDSFSWWLTP